jgi:formylmethanofuran dehydrogenase subunit E
MVAIDQIELYDHVRALHGFGCPEAALGVRFAEVATAELSGSDDRPLFVRTETAGCLVDALQVATGATIGNRRLTVNNDGKLAAVFSRPGTDHALRLYAHPSGPAYTGASDLAVAARRHRGEAVTTQDRARLNKLAEAILSAAPEELLIVTTMRAAELDHGFVTDFMTCSKCDELAREDRLFNHDGVRMCDECHLRSHGGALPAIHPRDPIFPPPPAHTH